jgi:hypothetical protein
VQFAYQRLEWDRSCACERRASAADEMSCVDQLELTTSGAAGRIPGGGRSPSIRRGKTSYQRWEAGCPPVYLRPLAIDSRCRICSFDLWTRRQRHLRADAGRTGALGLAAVIPFGVSALSSGPAPPDAPEQPSPDRDDASASQNRDRRGLRDDVERVWIERPCARQIEIRCWVVFRVHHVVRQQP